jgi:hypothetical protein
MLDATQNKFVFAPGGTWVPNASIITINFYTYLDNTEDACNTPMYLKRFTPIIKRYREFGKLQRRCPEHFLGDRIPFFVAERGNGSALHY